MRLALVLAMLAAIQLVAAASGEPLKLADGGRAHVPIVLPHRV